MVSLSNHIHQRLGLQKGKYILLSAHREENRWSSERRGKARFDYAESRQRKAIANIDTEKNFQSLFTAINRMAEKYDMPILYSCHPRSIAA